MVLSKVGHGLRRARAGRGFSLSAGAALALAAWCAAPGAGQIAQPSGQTGAAGLRRVEGGVGDVDPLGASLKQLSVDLRQPVGFGGVYQVPASRSPTGRAAFARMSGATVAVFDQSMYVASPKGPVAAIPPGTVFYIGGLPRARPAGTPGDPNLLVSTAVDMRAPVSVDMTSSSKLPSKGENAPGDATDSQSGAERVAEQWPRDAGLGGERPGTGMFGDEAYRGDRVVELLRRAARTARAGSEK
jgi:hypothetical protein